MLAGYGTAASSGNTLPAQQNCWDSGRCRWWPGPRSARGRESADRNHAGAGAPSPAVTAEAGWMDLLQDLARIPVWSSADPHALQRITAFCSSNCFDSGFCQETRQTNHGTPGHPLRLCPPAESVTPAPIRTTSGNHEQTSGTPLLPARNVTGKPVTKRLTPLL